MLQLSRTTDRLRALLLSLFLALVLLPTHCLAQAGDTVTAPPPPEPPSSATLPPIEAKIDTLKSFVAVRDQLLLDIKALNRQISTTKSETERQELNNQLNGLLADLRQANKNLEQVISGVDAERLQPADKEQYSFQKELFSLLKPALDEMKAMTSHVRKKSELREKISYYEEKLPIVQQALTNIEALKQSTNDKVLQKNLQASTDSWQKRLAFMQSELQAARLQLDELESSESSLAESSQSYMKSFFQKRGLYLTESLLLVVLTIFCARLFYLFLRRFLPGFQAKSRSFGIRLFELSYLLFTIFLIVVGPMIVFYQVEDWVLFSLGILLLMGIVLTMRQTVPMYWHQAQLFLNIGSVREGERLELDGLPWEVINISLYCTLYNPIAELSQRVPITGLVGLKSRPIRSHEPWFPCKRGDWVILANDIRGKVVGISIELVQLVERGGARYTLQTADFLASSPRNLSRNFRIKQTIGLTYALQKYSTTDIPTQLRDHVHDCLEKEGYSANLLDLRVEFEQAGNSSLDIVVIADFDGIEAEFYNRLERAIQRWCVDACTRYGWEIPFPQVTLHGAVTTEISGSVPA